MMKKKQYLKRRLYVKKTNRKELAIRWNFDSIANVGMYATDELYIQCTAKGFVNWDKNSVYTIDELLLRGNVIVLL